MDGNGRWAKRRGLPRKAGHAAGAGAFRNIVDYCLKLGVKYVTFYAFSTENWQRPKEEIDAIMKLFGDYLDESSEHIAKNVRICFLGDKSAFSDELQAKMLEAEQKSAHFTAMTLAVAVNYGGRDEIVRAVNEVNRQGIKNITAQMFGSFLDTKGLPDVDLVIRPSGEQRLSNFLIWQCAYAEYYFTDVLWPDFSPRQLDKALKSYAKRQRRFGRVAGC
jgi:undecaprenyl diphosphate synthase